MGTLFDWLREATVNRHRWVQFPYVPLRKKMTAIYVDYKINNLICGHVCIEEDCIDKQPSDVKLFNIRQIDYKFGAIVQRNDKFIKTTTKVNVEMP